jgi:hypothetical protein
MSVSQSQPLPQVNHITLQESTLLTQSDGFLFRDLNKNGVLDI